MIKLVTQFDNHKSKLSLATPTCGCCSCCCCCCIISSFAAASISARNFGSYVQKNVPNEPNKAKTARNIGFLYPIGLSILILLGFLVYISSLDYDGGIQGLVAMIFLAIDFLYLMCVASFAKKKLNLDKMSSLVIGSTGLLIGLVVAGFFGGLLFMLSEETIALYIILALSVAIILILKTFSIDYDQTNNKK